MKLRRFLYWMQIGKIKEEMKRLQEWWSIYHRRKNYYYTLPDVDVFSVPFSSLIKLLEFEHSELK